MRIATAHFTCPAKSGYGPAWAACNNHITVDLFNDGQYDNFNRPEGWHIELGTTPEQTIVRCPSHCEWVEYKEFRTGHWEDAPLPDPVSTCPVKSSSGRACVREAHSQMERHRDREGWEWVGEGGSAHAPMAMPNPGPDQPGHVHEDCCK